MGTKGMQTVEFARRSLAEQLAEQLGQIVASGRWKKGEQLPPVRTLAREHDVSVNTVREALRLMSGKGLVDLRPRQGAFVDVDVETSVDVRSQLAVIWPVMALDAAEGMHVMDRDPDSSWTTQIARTVELVVLEQYGWHQVSLPFFYGRQDGMRALFERMDRLGDSVGGAICFACPGIGPVIERLDRAGIPCVSINPPRRTSRFNYVMADNYGGGYRVGRCLCALGYERVLMLALDMRPGSSSSNRTDGLVHAFIEAGLSPGQIAVRQCAHWSNRVGYQETRAYLEMADQPPQAIFTIGDYLALGAMEACKEAGLDVPGDVGIIGGTGLGVAAYSSPTLTTLDQPMAEIGQRAAAMLVQMVNGNIRQIAGELVPSPIAFRQSLYIPAHMRDQIEELARIEEDDKYISPPAAQVV